MAKKKDVAINEPVVVAKAKEPVRKNYIKQVDDNEGGMYTATFDDGTQESKKIADYDAFVALFYSESWQEDTLHAWNAL